MAILNFGTVVSVLALTMSTVIASPYGRDAVRSVKTSVSSDDLIESILNSRQSTQSNATSGNRTEPGVATRPPTVLFVRWSSFNQDFLSAQEKGTVFHMTVHYGDIFNFMCHPTNPKLGLVYEEYSKIYEVTEEDFNDCILRNATQEVMTCDAPLADRQAIYRRGEPSGRQFFMVTSTGDRAGLNNTKGGMCKKFNMRLAVTLVESEGRKMLENTGKDHYVVDNRSSKRPRTTPSPRSQKLKSAVGSRLSQIAKIGEIIDYGVYEGPQMDQAQWRKAFEAQRKSDKPVSIDDLDPNVRKHIRPVSAEDESSQEETGNEVPEALALKSPDEVCGLFGSSTAAYRSLFLSFEMSPNDSSPSTPVSSTYDRVRVLDNPFAHLVANSQVSKFCSYCMRAPENGKLLRCASCEFSQYCNKDCQKLAWKMHRAECRRLKDVFPNLPLTEVLFMSRVIDRVLFLQQYGDKFGWESHRKWAELMGHEEDIKADSVKFEHFKKIHGKMSLFRKDEMISEEDFFTVYCKVTINSHSIHTSAGIEIGLALDLGVSVYDHSCRPNCSMVFDGFRVCLRPLTPEANAFNTAKSFISYIDVGRSRYQRRRDLQEKWYFQCRCERCEDPNDDVLTSLKCVNPSCDEPILTHETAEPMMISCSKCNTIADEEYVKNGQAKMLSLPPRYTLDSDPKQLQEMYDDASKILHARNIYLCRMQTAIFHITGKLQENLGVVQKQIFENYKMCFPTMDRHNGFQLLYMVKSLIEKGEREEAVSYAYDAMCIFEISFGMNHPYYLQTLALWTYLDTQANKSDEELLKLLHFGKFNKPVNLENILGHPQ